MFKINSALPVLCIVIYRPPTRNPVFLTTFSEFLASVVLHYDKIMIVGDFNFHVDNITDQAATEFLNITESYNFVQHVHGPTHNCGHTLDLVFTLDLDLDSLSIRDLVVSDHMCILLNTVLHATKKPQKQKVRFRVLNKETAQSFSSLFNTARENLSNFSDTNDQLLAFNQLCLSTLDIVAPLITKHKTTTKIAPWMNEDIHSLKRTCRKAERRWKSSKLQVHYLLLKDLLTAYNCKITESRDQYFSQLISTNQNNPRILFNTINQLVNSPPPVQTFLPLPTVIKSLPTS